MCQIAGVCCRDALRRHVHPRIEIEFIDLYQQWNWKMFILTGYDSEQTFLWHKILKFNIKWLLPWRIVMFHSFSFLKGSLFWNDIHVGCCSHEPTKNFIINFLFWMHENCAKLCWSILTFTSLYLILQNVIFYFFFAGTWKALFH